MGFFMDRNKVTAFIQIYSHHWCKHSSPTRKAHVSLWNDVRLSLFPDTMYMCFIISGIKDRYLQFKHVIHKINSYDFRRYMLNESYVKLNTCQHLAMFHLAWASYIMTVISSHAQICSLAFFKKNDHIIRLLSHQKKTRDKSSTCQ